MATAVKLSDDLVRDATLQASAMSRSIPKQIEHWAKIGKLAEENPELSYALLRGLLVGLAEVENGQVTEYQFG